VGLFVFPSSVAERRNRQTAVRSRTTPRALRASRPAISQWLAGPQPSKFEYQIPRFTFANQKDSSPP